MKKILRLIFVALSTLAIVFLVYSLSLGMLKYSADSDFKNGRYEKAADKYEWVLICDFFDSKNEKVKYNLADSLVQLPFNYKTQTKIINFLELYEHEPFAYPLREKLNKFKADLDWKIGPNYIDKVPNNNKLLRWEDDAFPLKVYISNGAQEYRDAVRKAFEYWQYVTGNFVSFAYIENSSDADIIVNLTGDAKINCEEEQENCLYVAALTSPKIKGDILEYMNMMIHTSDPNGRNYPPSQIYKVALHEIGHALGMMGHSDNPDDIMYASDQHHEDDVFADHVSALSRRDLNTLNFLYMIVPNVSNIPEEKHNTVNKIHPNVILGTSEEIKERDIRNAMAYVNKAPNLAVGYMDLGNAYVQSEMYEKAFQTYEKGYSLSSDNNEKYNFVYNMSLVCLRMGDKDKALEYAEFAQKIMPTDEIQKLIHDIRNPYGLGNSRF